MREILDEVFALLEQGDGFALATVVAEQGSAPRAIGAEMLVRADGSIAGTIGGGRLEAAMTAAAVEALGRRRSVVASFALDGDSVRGERMLCGGRVDVLLSNVPPGDAGLAAVCRGVERAARSGVGAWAFTFYEGDGGEAAVARCLLLESDEVVGAAPCDAAALRRLTAAHAAHGAASLPDGRRVHIERLAPPQVAIVCGAGHVGWALAPLAATLGFRTVVLDDRPEFADPARFPSGVDVVLLDGFETALAKAGVGEHSYVVIVTRGHEHDLTVLSQALRSPARYIGLMASRTKRAHVFEALRGLGFGDADLARVHTPIGLSIGAETPAELAVSIAGELVQARASRAP